MATNEELEKRIETLEKEVQHLKAILQYQMRNKKNWLILIAKQLLFDFWAFHLSILQTLVKAKY